MLPWIKDRMGTGEWLRGQTEHCMLAVRGKPVILLGRMNIDNSVMYGVISPDGRSLAYVASQLSGVSVWIRQVTALGVLVGTGYLPAR